MLNLRFTGAIERKLFS